MKKRVLLTTIGPKGSGVPGIQLALYYLKSYFFKYSPKKDLAEKFEKYLKVGSGQAFLKKRLV